METKEMRAFKFRAWNKEESKFIDTFEIEPNGDVWVPLDGEECCFDVTDKVIIMQFTGLKDKNGKDIYEGDIVNYGEYSGVIVWMGMYSQFVIQNTHDYGNNIKCEPDTISEWHDDIVVVGNIYENPELLK